MARDILENVGLDEDPGWGFRSGGLLGMLRRLTIAFAFAILLMGSFIQTLGELTEKPGPTIRSVAVVVAFGCNSLVTQRFLGSALDGTTTRTFADSYRTRFFLRIAFSESVALVAFVVYIVWGPTWIYFIGAGFTLIGFWRLAPTRQHLQQDQDRLSLAGCQLSLIEALSTPTT